MRMFLAATAAVAASTALPSDADGRNRMVRCVIDSNGEPTWRGPCNFIPDGGGSFTVASPLGREFPGGFTGISVFISEPGVADVYGLTPTGPAFRLGTAVRSRRDRACWEGPDFSICAY